MPYAFCQIPFGYLADRFGPRWVLSILMFLWSACTALLGWRTGYTDFYLYRFGCGVFEAGGYPACVGIIKRWIPCRGAASRAAWFRSAAGSAGRSRRLDGVAHGDVRHPVLRGPDEPPVLFSWQPTLWIFGFAGMVFATVFWFYFRDNPAEHPGCNEAERALILGTPPPAESLAAGSVAATAITASSPAAITPGAAPPPANRSRARAPLPTIVMPLTPFGIMMSVLMFLASGPWRSLVTNANLWCSSFIQFGANVAMVFVSVYFNRYLTEVHGIDDNVVRSRMISANFVACLPALLVGGWLTDAMVKRVGIRWGIALPMALPRFGAAVLIFSVPFLLAAWPEVSLTRAWVVVGVVALASFCRHDAAIDLGIRSAIGGKIVPASFWAGGTCGATWAAGARPTTSRRSSRRWMGCGLLRRGVRPFHYCGGRA